MLSHTRSVHKDMVLRSNRRRIAKPSFRSGLAVCILVSLSAIALGGCRSESSANSGTASENAEQNRVAAPTIRAQAGFWYARTEDGPQVHGWLVRLDSGNRGTMFVGDRPVKICSVVRSDSALAFTTAEDGAKTYKFVGKYTQDELVGDLSSAGGGSGPRQFGTTRLIPLDTGSLTAGVLGGHTGLYSTIHFDEREGDALGSEVVLLVAAGKPALLFQQPEGVKSLLVSPNSLQAVGDTLKFSFGQPPDMRRLSITFGQNSLVLHDPDAVDPPSAAHEILPRTMSLERLMYSPANGLCAQN